MDERIDTGDQPLERPFGDESEGTGEEIFSDNEPVHAAPEPETTHMEVHKHPHHVTHKKKWSEYLLEFFMIFLAVFLGFLAETEREHIVEKDRERQFMSSMVRDLQLDTLELAKGHSFRLGKIATIDSMISYLGVQQGNRIPAPLYRLTIKYFANRNFFQNSGTLDQLKNSGGLRLINNRMIVDSIEAYDQQVKRMAKRDDFEVDAFMYNSRIGQKLFDARSVVKAYGFSDNPLVLKDSTISIPLNPVFLDEYLNSLRSYEFLIKNNDGVFESNRTKALNLLNLIMDKYHLE
jgi:hypothetical protein